MRDPAVRVEALIAQDCVRVEALIAQDRVRVEALIAQNCVDPSLVEFLSGLTLKVE